MTVFELFKNADSPEQMADLFIECAGGDGNCNGCFAYEFCFSEKTCKQAFLDWLNATAAID